MNMKKVYTTAVLFGLALFSNFTQADTPLQSPSEIQGSWKLDYTKKNATASENLKREDTWTFNDSKVTITHIPRDGAYYDQTPVVYVIEDGKLKISLLGRPDKFDTFSLVEKSEKYMTLKGKYGDIYVFSKK